MVAHMHKISKKFATSAEPDAYTALLTKAGRRTDNYNTPCQVGYVYVKQLCGVG